MGKWDRGIHPQHGPYDPFSWAQDALSHLYLHRARPCTGHPVSTLVFWTISSPTSSCSSQKVDRSLSCHCGPGGLGRRRRRAYGSRGRTARHRAPHQPLLARGSAAAAAHRRVQAAGSGAAAASAAVRQGQVAAEVRRRAHLYVGGRRIIGRVACRPLLTVWDSQAFWTHETSSRCVR